MKRLGWAALVLAAVVAALAAWLRRGASPAVAPVDRAPASAVTAEREAAAAPDAAAEASRREALAAEIQSRAVEHDVTGLDTRLRGRVVDEAGAPIAGATVRLTQRRDDEYESLDLARGNELDVLAGADTDARGEFAFEVELGRPYRVTATVPSRAPVERPFCYAGQEIVLVLARWATVTGRVTRAADGSPVERAVVEVRPRFVEGEPRARGGRVSAETDALGEYRVSGIAPGAWELRVDPPDLAMASGFELDLAPGEVATQDVAVEDGIEIRGLVLDADTGAGIAGAEVGQGWTFSRIARTDLDGAYVLRGFARDYVYLHARAEGYGAGEATVVRGAEVRTRVDFALTRARRVRGRVLDSGGAPLADVYVAAAASDHDGPDGMQRHDWPSSYTGADGAFRIEGLRADMRHALVARKRGHGTVVYDFPDDELSLHEIALPDVTLPTPGSVRGEIVDEHGAPYPGREIALAGTNADRRRFTGGAMRETWSIDTYVARRTARTDHRGRFAFVDVAPGPDYVLHGQLPDSHEGFTRPVEVVAGAETSGVRIVIERGREISGRVLVSDGGATPVVYVSVDPEGAGRSADVQCELDGRFRATGLADTRYTLTAYPYPRPQDEGAGRWFAPTTLEGVAAGRTDVVIELRAGVTIRGRVLDLDGRAVAGATLSASDASTEWLDTAASDADGRFALKVPAGGIVDLVARPPGEHPDASLATTLRGVVVDGSELILRLPWRP